MSSTKHRKSYQRQPEQHEVVAATRIQSWFRGHISRSFTKKLMSNLFKRKKIIEELILTEENYIRDLSIIVADFKMAMLSHKIINKAESIVIFSNVDEIRKLNELFFAFLFNQANHYTNYRVIFEQLEKRIYFFRMYFQYFNNFTLAAAKIQQLTEERKQFAEFIKSIRKNQKYKMLTIQDYLVKPIQRLPKYVLIFKQIKKLTPLDHPDRKNIEKVLKTFQEVNINNNEKLNKVVNNLKINELQKNINLNHTLAEPGVQFILEEPVTILSADNRPFQCTLYLLNVQIIITRMIKGQERLVVCVPFKNSGGTIMENQDQFFYKNCFTVQNYEGDSCTFLCNTEEEKLNLIQKIFNQIIIAQKKCQQKMESLLNKKSVPTSFFCKIQHNDLLPEITILGTEERSDTMFKYTIYIIEVKIKNIKQKIFLRFSQILELQVYIKTIFPNIEIKQSLYKNTWIMNHKPIKIQERKMNIHRFLKEILTKKEIVQDGAKILVKLGLPADFYSLPEKYKETDDLLKKSTVSQRSTGSHQEEKSEKLRSISKSCRLSLFQSVIEESEEDFKCSKNKKQKSKKINVQKKITIQEILQANEINLGHFTRFSEIIQPEEGFEFEELMINVFLPWIENEKGLLKVQLKMKTNQRVLCLLLQLSKQIGLKYYKDFRLFLERQYAYRLLDDDQYLPKVVEEMKAGKYRMIFKKMIYIDSEIEDKELKNDRMRLKIIASQVVYEARKDKYLLSYNHFMALAVLTGISQVYSGKDFDQVHEQHNFPQLNCNTLAQKTREMVSNKFTAFFDAKKTWNQDYKKLYKRVFSQLRKISNFNSTIYRESNIFDSQKEYNSTNIAQLAAFSIIKEIKKSEFYGSVSYIVQISQEFRKTLKEKLDENNDSEEQIIQNRNCWLIMNYRKLSLYSISLKTEIFSFTYDDIYKIQPYPSSILIYLRGREIDFIKLKTTTSYNIRQLLVYYKHYGELMKKLNEDQQFQESVIILVKEQMRQSYLGGTSQESRIMMREVQEEEEFI